MALRQLQQSTAAAGRPEYYAGARALIGGESSAAYIHQSLAPLQAVHLPRRATRIRNKPEYRRAGGGLIKMQAVYTGQRSTRSSTVLEGRSAQAPLTYESPPRISRPVEVQQRDAQVRAQADDQEQLAFLEAQLRLLANAAADRAEMHAILAQQRDNWNKLFQSTLTAASLSACLLAAFSAVLHNGGAAAAAPSLSVPALVLNAGCAAIMSAVNRFQPSQLAEEQRNAARQFRRLVNDIEYALQAPLHLRQSTPTLLRDSQQRLHALDAAFPMPLTPGGLDKFPSKVTPPALLNIHDHEPGAASRRAVGGCPTPPSSTNIAAAGQSMAINHGWDESRSEYLEQLALQVRGSDTDMYVGWAHNVIKVNKCLAVAAPVLTASAAALNAVGLVGGVMQYDIVGWTGTLAALCSLTAAFVGSISHDLQLGTVFEMYRNAAGHYAEAEESIHQVLQEQPVDQREHGLLFLHRVAYKLGRWDHIE